MNQYPGYPGPVQFIPVQMPHGSSVEDGWKVQRRLQKAIDKAVAKATGGDKKKDENPKKKTFTLLEVIGITHLLSIPLIYAYWYVGKSLLMSAGLLN